MLGRVLCSPSSSGTAPVFDSSGFLIPTVLAILATCALGSLTIVHVTDLGNISGNIFQLLVSEEWDDLFIDLQKNQICLSGLESRDIQTECCQA